MINGTCNGLSPMQHYSLYGYDTFNVGNISYQIKNKENDLYSNNNNTNKCRLQYWWHHFWHVLMVCGLGPTGTKEKKS